MKLRNLLTAAAVAVFLAGPATGLLHPSPANAGVSVGNAGPQLAYWSPAGKFAVQYAAGLSLKVQSEEAFEISNEQLLAGGEPASRVAFSVTPNKVASETELASALRQEYPERRFIPVSLNGATALASEEQRDGHLNALYFLLTSENNLVSARVDASAAGNGLALIAPIVKTYAPDTTAPSVFDIRLKSPLWQAGERQTILVKATDDLSGLDGMSNVELHLLNDRGEIPFGRENFRFRAGGFDYKESLKAVGDGWYAWSVPIGANVPAGEYAITSFLVSDHAGNWTTLIAPSSPSENVPVPPYYRAMAPFQGKGPVDTKISVIRVRIGNAQGKVDTTAPVFQGFRPDATVWEAGSRHRVYFRASDCQSGLNLEKSTLASFTDAAKKFYIGGPGSLRAEGNGWYSDEYVVPATQPSGEYILGLPFLIDQAENLAGEEDVRLEQGLVYPLKIRVQNAGREERRPPIVDQWRVETPSVAPGGTVRMSVHFANDRDDITRLDVSFVGPANSGAYEFADEFRKRGGGWYELDVKIGKYAPAGTFTLRSLKAQSEVGSAVEFECALDGTRCRFDDEEARPALPELSFRVVR